MPIYDRLTEFSRPHSRCESARPSRHQPDDPDPAVMVGRRIEHTEFSATRAIDDIDLPDGLNRRGIIATHWFGARQFDNAIVEEPQRAA